MYRFFQACGFVLFLASLARAELMTVRAKEVMKDSASTQARVVPEDKVQTIPKEMEGPVILDKLGEVAATLKVAVWVDDKYEYRTHLIELHGSGRTIPNYDGEIEFYTIAKTGAKEHETTAIRIPLSVFKI
mmetsp:Transcript_32518/g.40304  ORF Transcript_32518/g.40304 Transcript_32518/m.40304 type:complete len:131 (+) Transcript_32518:2-394(+)